jgi:hypothetical protein
MYFSAKLCLPRSTTEKQICTLVNILLEAVQTQLLEDPCSRVSLVESTSVGEQPSDVPEVKIVVSNLRHCICILNEADLSSNHHTEL